MADKRIYPESKRIPKNHCCKNCEYIVVKIGLPAELEDDDFSDAQIANFMRKVAKATKVCHDSDFYCTFAPEWKPIKHELIHYCRQLLLRANWQLGYQDIERVWEDIDKVYATRWDCKLMPEGVRRRTEGVQCKVIKSDTELNSFLNEWVYG